MESISVRDGSLIVDNLIVAIHDNKQYLSDIDGAIGDGDHGINMNKGFMLCMEALEKEPGDLIHSLNTLSKILIMKIGGSMGPLYGKFFKAMAISLDGKSVISKFDFLMALENVILEIGKISSAKPGDKTLMDTLVPAVGSFKKAVEEDKSFKESLEIMVKSARTGRDSTKDMIALIGRASRLGERSRGVLDAGAASCFIILDTMAESVKQLLL